MSCPYCTQDESNEHPEDIACDTYISAVIDGNQLWVRVRYERAQDWIGLPTGEVETFINVRHCPMCGRKL